MRGALARYLSHINFVGDAKFPGYLSANITASRFNQHTYYQLQELFTCHSQRKNAFATLLRRPVSSCRASSLPATTASCTPCEPPPSIPSSFPSTSLPQRQGHPPTGTRCRGAELLRLQRVLPRPLNVPTYPGAHCISRSIILPARSHAYLPSSEWDEVCGTRCAHTRKAEGSRQQAPARAFAAAGGGYCAAGGACRKRNEQQAHASYRGV